MAQLHESDHRMIALIHQNENYHASGPAPRVNTLHFLEFTDQALSSLAADEALAQGWAIDQGPHPDPNGTTWNLSLKGTGIEISESNIARIRTKLTDLATSYGGKYQSWGAAVSPTSSLANTVRVFEPLNQQAQQYLDVLRSQAEEISISGNPTAITAFFNLAFSEWFATEGAYSPHSSPVLPLIAAALGDWISQYTDLEWALMFEGATESQAKSSPATVVLHNEESGAVMFIFDSVAKRWGSSERLDDFAFGAVRQIRSQTTPSRDLPPLPDVIRVAPFDHVDADYKNQQLSQLNSLGIELSPEGIEAGFAHIPHSESAEDDMERVISQQNEMVEALGFGFGEHLISTLPVPSEWVTVHKSDGTVYDAITTATGAYPPLAAIQAFVQRSGTGFADYALAVQHALAEDMDPPAPQHTGQ